MAAAVTPAPAAAPARTVGFARHLERFGDRVAVTADGRDVTYAALAEAADAFAGRHLAGARRLVAIEARNDLPSVVAYLAALRADHAVVLLGAGCPAGGDDVVATYAPDIVIGAGCRPVERRPRRSSRDLHPDLALLLSTSGSTGSPKLVRLSHTNLEANAGAIATYLGLGHGDVAMTTLPMHYCFGLSVINSHLAAGAALVLSDRSVVDRTFWDVFDRSGATSFAGVPYTFDLLDRVGFAGLALPRLRQVVQAGGRLAPEQVRRYAEMGEAAGWELFVMYGQTEATARMAYLPPGQARRHPSAIGVPIPGGSFAIEPVEQLDRSDGGELVYRGPNVMLGYAERPEDLAAGRTIEMLRTGDLARRNEAGLYEIVGRRSRFVKLFGLRLDLDRVEAALEAAGFDVRCTGDDDRLVVAWTSVADGPGERDLLAVLQRRFDLPPARLALVRVADLPRLANGKTDYAAILAAAPPARGAGAAGPGAGVPGLFAEIFPGARIGADDTFASLGGDSLSYVEMSVRLEETLGHLPEGWPEIPVGRLAAEVPPPAPPRRHRLRDIETNVVLRALALVAVVGTHAGLFRLRGGAHLLLALAGFNFARFQVAAARARSRPPRLAGSVARVVVPSAVWMAVLLMTTDDYDLTNLLLVHGHLGETRWDQRWRYWYIEAIVQILVVAGATLAVPAVRRLERRAPWAFAAGAFVLAFAVRILLVDVGGIARWTHRPQTVAWIFTLGWLAAVSRGLAQKVVVSALVTATAPSFFVDDGRAAMLIGGLLLVVWLPTLRVPAAAARLAAATAAASLHVYLTHWQVYPAVLATQPPLVAVLASFVAGVSAWRLAGTVESGLGRRRRRRQPAVVVPAAPLAAAVAPRSS